MKVQLNLNIADKNNNLVYQMILYILLILLLVFFFIEKSKFQEKVNKKIVILTAENRNDNYIKLHDLNFAKYSNLNRYKYVRMGNCDKTVATTYWCKIYKVKDLLESGERFDYVMWADSDTIITSDTRLEDYIYKFGDPDIIIGTDCLINCHPLHILNAGVFIIKNSKVGLEFINECISSIKPGCIVDGKEQGEWAGECYEQGVMNKLISEKYKDVTYIDRNNELIYNDWGNNYKKILRQESKPLVIHLCGVSNKNREIVFSMF
jgi:hypothetical protein